MSLQPVSRSAIGAPPQAPSAATTALREFLAFKLGAKEYGIDILRVQEIRSYEDPIRVAYAPDFIKGVVTLRGVIVLDIGKRVMGLVVDAVSDVITLTPEQLHPVPELNSAIASDHLLAISAVDSRMLILVDIEKLMTSSELGFAEQTLQ